MRITLKIFAILDIICIAFLAFQLWAVVQDGTMPAEASDKLKLAAMFLSLLLLCVSAAGLFFARRIGFITHYLLFPLRIWLWIFSIGFITLLPEAFSYYGDFWFDWLFRACVVCEFIRLYFTVRFHFQLARK